MRNDLPVTGLVCRSWVTLEVTLWVYLCVCSVLFIKISEFIRMKMQNMPWKSCLIVTETASKTLISAVIEELGYDGTSLYLFLPAICLLYSRISARRTTSPPWRWRKEQCGAQTRRLTPPSTTSARYEIANITWEVGSGGRVIVVFALYARFLSTTARAMCTPEQETQASPVEDTSSMDGTSCLP